MNNRMIIKNWIEKFNNGDFDRDDRAVMSEACWNLIWDCSIEKIREKTNYIGNIINKLSNSSKISLNIQRMQISWHSAFDSVDIFNGDELLYLVLINNRFGLNRENKFMVYGLVNGCVEALIKCDDKKELVNWFNQ